MEKKERKNNLITVRIADEDMATVEYLSDCTNQSKSEVIIRACKYYLNMREASIGEIHNRGFERVHKRSQVHLRVTDSDMELLNKRGRENGLSLAELVRAGIREYDRFQRKHY